MSESSEPSYIYDDEVNVIKGLLHYLNKSSRLNDAGMSVEIALKGEVREGEHEPSNFGSLKATDGTGTYVWYPGASS